MPNRRAPSPAPIRPRGSLDLRLAAFALASLCLAPAASAQRAGDIYVAYGHTGQVELVPPEKLARVAPVTESVASKGIAWNVTYMDVVGATGKGFDGPNGPAARATITAVLQYIGSVIGNGGGADIVFENSQTDGGGFLAVSGTYYQTGQAGFSGGFVHDHIVNGVDPSASTPFDGTSTYDFGFNWHFDSTTPPAAGQEDFFSSALHEITHMLGFLSLTKSDGSSSLGGNVRTVIDRDMQTGGGKALFSATGAFLGSASDLAGGAGGVVLAQPEAMAAYGSAPRLYAPSPFSNGASLSHYDSSVSGAVMQPVLITGVVRRAYTTVELATLAGMGYTLSSGPLPTITPSPTISLTPSPTPQCAQAVYSQQFSSGLGGWTFGGQQGLWHVTSACSAALSGHSSAAALAYMQDSTCNYDNGQTNFGYAYSPRIDLTGIAAPITLSFNYYLQTEGDSVFDLARFDVSSDAFATLTTIAVNNGGNLADPSGGWRSFAADLSAFAGKKLSLRLLFATGDAQNNKFAGWFIDDIQVCASVAAPTPTPTPTPSPTPVSPNGAALYLQSIPPSATSGIPSLVTIAMRNTGASVWRAVDGYSLAVVSDPCGMLAQAATRIQIPGQAEIAPGQACFFSTTLVAPAVGSCELRLRMVQEFVEFFGDVVNATVEVSAAPTLDAAVTAQSIPQALAQGRSVPFTIEMRNMGATPWSGLTGFALVATDPCGVVPTASRRIAISLGTTVAPGESYTFTGTLLLPSGAAPVDPGAPAGSCRVSFQMAQDGAGAFGASATQVVGVTNAVEVWAGYD